ncbi:MAG TPA: arsenate reductase ArsC [Chthoniobacterales bacterium]|jgi:arsenate reductase
MKRKVLFVCIHNSARSQMAEALLSQCWGESFEAESAGLDPGQLNPLAVEVLREKGLDISRKPTRSVDDLIAAGKQYDYVITVCDEGSAAGCPVFPGCGERLHWSFPDPSGFTGTQEERLEQTRRVRDLIGARINAWRNRESPTAPNLCC